MAGRNRAVSLSSLVLLALNIPRAERIKSTCLRLTNENEGHMAPRFHDTNPYQAGISYIT